MSAPLDVAVLLVSTGAAGAALTSITEGIRSWIKRHTKPNVENQGDVKVVIRRGDEKLEITGKIGEEMVEIINILLRQESASSTPDSATVAQNPDSDGLI